MVNNSKAEYSETLKAMVADPGSLNHDLTFCLGTL